jgi:lipoprotein NlpD
MMQRRYLVIGFLVLTGCAAPKGKAPVETRAIGSSQTAPAIAKKPPVAPGGGASSASSAPTSPSASESGSAVPSGFYRVKRGDTLISIALEQGVDWRDLASWNDISNPNVIEVGRLLRILQARPADAPAPSVAAVPTAPGAAQTAPVAGVGAVQARPIEAGSSTGGASAPAPTVAAAPPATELASAAPAPAAAGLQWAWPAHGQVISGFSEGGSKGVAIAGAQGEAIFAAESGRVIYSGNGLRGYGNLVIVKHDQEFTTAYAHNRAILVKEGQMVRRGQKIAELGMSDADRPMLHFEVRKGGKPVDPLSFLPSR